MSVFGLQQLFPDGKPVAHLAPLTIIAPPSGSCIQTCSSSAAGPLLIAGEPNNNRGCFARSSTPSSSISNPSSSTDGESSSSSPSSRVIVRTYPKKRKEVVKDETYWERRKKNNDAAKRSRDQRRLKEDEVASRALSLERENAMLREELQRLRAETSALHTIIVGGSAQVIQRQLSAPTPQLHPAHHSVIRSTSRETVFVQGPTR
ncbi:unnamed protein product, partial [Mesorhabditis spiculigera]